MVRMKRFCAGLLVTALAAAWVSGCSSSDQKAVGNAGSAGVAEAGSAAGGAGPEAAGTSADGGTAGGGEPAMSDAGSAGNPSSAGSAGEAGASGEPDPRAPFAEWDATRAAAQCKKSVACGKEYSVATCLTAALGTASYDAYYGGADYYGYQLDNYSFASQAVQQACLADIAAAACDARAPASCAAVLVALAPAAKGAFCRSSSAYLPALPCAAGLACSNGAPCSVCVEHAPPADLNGACDYPEDCKPGLTCRVIDNVATCQKPALLGEPCTLEEDCAEGVCAGTCQPYVLEGKACSDSAPCLRGLSCSPDDNLCHPNPAPQPGEACSRHSSAPSDACSAWCVFATPDAAIGKCGVPDMKSRSPCSRLAGSSALGCPFGSYADAEPATNADGISDSCTCQPRRPLGAVCTTFQQCLDGQCTAAEGGGSVCSKRLAAGAACTGPGQCEGYCDDETNQCVGPVVCVP